MFGKRAYVAIVCAFILGFFGLTYHAPIDNGIKAFLLGAFVISIRDLVRDALSADKEKEKNS